MHKQCVPKLCGKEEVAINMCEKSEKSFISCRGLQEWLQSERGGGGELKRIQGWKSSFLMSNTFRYEHTQGKTFS